MYFCASATTALSEAVAAEQPAEVGAGAVQPGRRGGARPVAGRRRRVRLMRNRAWISLIRAWTWVTPSTAPPRRRRSSAAFRPARPVTRSSTARSSAASSACWQRDLVALAQLLQALGALGGRGPLRADELGLLRLRGGQRAGVGGVGGGRAHAASCRARSRWTDSERGSTASASAVSYSVGPAVGVGGGVRGLRRGGRGGPLLGAAQLQDRLQPEGGALHEPLHDPLHPLPRLGRRGRLTHRLLQERLDRRARAARARSTRASVPGW